MFASYDKSYCTGGGSSTAPAFQGQTTQTNKTKHKNHSNEAVRQLQQGNQPLIKLKKSVRRNESKTFISLETWFLLAEILSETLWPLRLGWIRVLLLALEAPFNHRFKGANKNKTKKRNLICASCNIILSGRPRSQSRKLHQHA